METDLAKEMSAVREGRRVIWWNVVIGMVAANALYNIVPAYQVFIVLLVLIRILAIVFEYMLFRAFRQVSLFTSISGITYAWGAAFLCIIGGYSYQVAEIAFHYGMTVSPYYQIPFNIFLGFEGVALLLLGYYFGKLPSGYGKLAFYGRLTHVLFGLTILGSSAITMSASLSYLSDLTVYIEVIMLFLTVLTEYMILSRTLKLLPEGNPSRLFDPEPKEDRKMFERLADFGYVRSKKQALGFYIAYFVTVVLSLTFIGFILARAFPVVFTADNSFALGVLGACTIFTLLSFLILRDKKLLKRFSSVVYLILTLIAAICGGSTLALVVVAFLTTRKSADMSDAVVVRPAPLPPHTTIPSHIAVIDEDPTPLPVVVHNEVHEEAAAAVKAAPARKRAVPKKSRVAKEAKIEAKPVRKTRARKTAEPKTVLEEKLQEKLQEKLEGSELKVTSPVVRDVA